MYAQVFNNEALSQVKTSNIESGSSLFASISTDRSAEIGSFRHLENLDERVSGWDPDQLYTGAVTTSKTVTAMQNSDLTWKAGENIADESGYCGHVAKLHTAFGSNFLNQNAETISIAYRVTDQRIQIGRTRRYRHIPRRREAIFRLVCRIHWTIREIHTGSMVCR